MQLLAAPNTQLALFQEALEKLLGHPLTYVNHVLFPGCIYLTSLQHNDEMEDENFYLIYDLKKNRNGILQCKIHFLQIPLCCRSQKLGSKVYQLLEQLLREQGCQCITLEARVNSLNPKDNSVGFWGKQGFMPGVHYAFDDENFPMIKRLA
ncbi:GNAT family N-acetyltransferase [Desulforamulus ferrireducens]|nr:GNAT family N-acetyltransferase [Desulforamulus ferrireducens]